MSTVVPPDGSLGNKEDGSVTGKQSVGSEKQTEGGKVHDRLLHRLWALVREENKRLDRLIARLHLRFTPGSYTREEVYDHICRSVAEYFEAPAAELYLRDFEEACRTGEKASAQAVLRLRGAAGPWERALRPKYFRRKPSDVTVLPQDAAAMPPNLTAYIAQLGTPRVMTSRPDFEEVRRTQTGRQGRAPAEAEQHGRHEPDLTAHQVVWEHCNLYSVSRNLAGAPLRRYHAGLIEAEGSEPRKVDRYEAGALKVENRCPPACDAFKLTQPIEATYLHTLWPIVALRPYLDDLSRSPSPFSPLGNNFSWRRRYADMPSARIHFDQLYDWLKEQKRAGREPAEVTPHLDRARERVGRLVSVVVEAETLLAQIQRALDSLALDQEVDEAERAKDHDPPHLPSLLNLVNVGRHCFHQPEGYRCGDWRANCPIRRAMEAFVPGQLAAEVTRLLAGGEEPLTAERLLTRGEVVSQVSVDETSASLIGVLTDMAQRVLGASSHCRTSDPGLREELNTAAAVAREMLEAKEHVAGVSSVRLLADLSAKSTMYSHTFSVENEKDRVRLMYVAHHVMQVLDQQLLREAQQMEVPAGTDDVVLLRLSGFHLRCLRDVKAAADEVMEWLAYHVYAQAALRDKEVEVTREPLHLAEFLRHHRNIANKQYSGAQLPLFAIGLTGEPSEEFSPPWEVTELQCLSPAPNPLLVVPEKMRLAVRMTLDVSKGIDYTTPGWLVELRDGMIRLRDELRQVGQRETRTR